MENGLINLFKGNYMIELNKADFPSILPLVTNSNQAVIPLSITQGINPGRIFVDQKENPAIVLIWTTVGYYFLFGDPASANLSQISQIISEIFVPASQDMGETGFILIPSRDDWKPFIASILSGQEVIEIFRMPHSLDKQQFLQTMEKLPNLPKGFEIREIDTDLAKRIGILASWATIEDFLNNGVGFAIMKDDQLAAYCYSVFLSEDAIEIDVYTNENFRKLGLAKVVSSTLIDYCLENGKKPNWECFWNNSPSLRLAEKLGYSAKKEYPVYFWEMGG